MILIVFDGALTDSLIVRAIEKTETTITLKGEDLKGLLNQRITLFPADEFEAGTYGYDVATGYTGSIIEHYCDYNVISPDDNARRIPGLNFGSGSQAGISDDTYMSRLQPVSDVVSALCKNAGICYNVKAEIARNGYFINVFEGADRSTVQNENNRAVFSLKHLTAHSMKYEFDSSAHRNVLWAVNGGNKDKAYVKAVMRDNEDTIGWERRECVVTVNADTADEIDVYALKEAEDAVETETLTFEVVNPDEYGISYNIGDRVTVFGEAWGYVKTVLQAEKQYTAAEKKVYITVGDVTRVKPIPRISEQAKSTEHEIVEMKLDHEESGGGGSGFHIENAVILSENQAAYILHKYNEISYVSGQRAVYSEVGSSIIAQGFSHYNGRCKTVIDGATLAETFPDGVPSGYNSFNLNLATNSGVTTTNYLIEAYHEYVNDSYGLYIRYSSDGGTTWTVSRQTAYGTFDRPDYFIYWKFTGIYAPTEAFPYGYTTASLYKVGHIKSYDGYRETAVGITNVTNSMKILFASEAEYNAAIALTYEPNILTEVVETTTESN